MFSTTIWFREWCRFHTHAQIATCSHYCWRLDQNMLWKPQPVAETLLSLSEEPILHVLLLRKKYRLDALDCILILSTSELFAQFCQLCRSWYTLQYYLPVGSHVIALDDFILYTYHRLSKSQYILCVGSPCGSYIHDFSLQNNRHYRLPYAWSIA